MGEDEAGMNDDKHTAIHEAGHAVVGRALGMSCGHVTIEADDDSAGHHIVADPWQIMFEWEQRDRYRDASVVFHGRIMTFMAGALAETEFFGISQGGDGDDQWQVALMAEAGARITKISGEWDSDRDRQLARLRSRAAYIVHRHRLRIERVAAALLERRSLTADEVDTILAG